MVSTEYLDRIGFATIRREPGDDTDVAMDALLCDYIEQARADMAQKGVARSVVEDETDAAVMGCVQSYVRWRMAYTVKDDAANLEEYRMQMDELRKSGCITGLDV